jgi:hypothetical protein
LQCQVSCYNRSSSNSLLHSLFGSVAEAHCLVTVKVSMLGDCANHN